MTHHRRADARLDAIASASEGRITGNTSDPDVMLAEHAALLNAGVLDPDQPTPWSHRVYMTTLHAEFTPTERAIIRSHLGLAGSETT